MSAYTVYELLRPTIDLFSGRVKGDVGEVQIGSWDEADEILNRVFAENHGGEPLVLGIYDAATKTISVRGPSGISWWDA